MSDPAVIAHRCFAGVAPENTVGAALEALERDAISMLEIDVQPGRCGTPVVFHDARLEGTRDGRSITDERGHVAETSLETIRRANVLDTTETVPTLDVFLETLPSTAGVNVELKRPGNTSLRVGESLPADELEDRQTLWEPFVSRVVDVCADFRGELLFSSFCEGAIAALREVEPRYAAAPLVWHSLEDGLDIARRYDCEAIHPPRNAVRGTGLASESYLELDGEPAVDVVEIAHDEGRAVNVWTVETWGQFAQLAAVGVDGIIAEYPGLGSFRG